MPNPGDILVGKYSFKEFEYIGPIGSGLWHAVAETTHLYPTLINVLEKELENYTVKTKPTFFEEGKTYEEIQSSSGSTFTVSYVAPSPDTDKMFAFGWWKSGVNWIGSDAVGSALSEEDFSEFKEVQE